MSPSVPNPALVPPGAVGATQPAIAPQRGGTSATPVRGPAFADVLARQTAAADPPKFSRHAADRLRQRGIELTGPTLDRLTNGVSLAASKGARDSVVLVDNTAFVVSVRNNTVITAVGSEHMRQHVFTNIDSAVIA